MRPHFWREIWKRRQCRPPLACHFRLIFLKAFDRRWEKNSRSRTAATPSATFRALNPSCFCLLSQAPPKASEPRPGPWTAADNTWFNGTGMSWKKTDRVMSFNRQRWKGTDETIMLTKHHYFKEDGRKEDAGRKMKEGRWRKEDERRKMKEGRYRRQEGRKEGRDRREVKWSKMTWSEVRWGDVKRREEKWSEGRKEGREEEGTEEGRKERRERRKEARKEGRKEGKKKGKLGRRWKGRKEERKEGRKEGRKEER